MNGVFVLVADGINKFIWKAEDAGIISGVLGSKYILMNL